MDTDTTLVNSIRSFNKSRDEIMSSGNRLRCDLDLWPLDLEHFSRLFQMSHAWWKSTKFERNRATRRWDRPIDYLARLCTRFYVRFYRAACNADAV